MKNMKNILNNFNNDILIINEGKKIEFCSKSLLLNLKYDYHDEEGLKLLHITGNIEEYINGEEKINFELRYKRVAIKLRGRVFVTDWKGDKIFLLICEKPKEGLGISKKPMNHERLKDMEKVRKEFQKRIIAEQDLEDFLEAATDLMAIIDHNGQFIKVNNGWAKTLGFKREELLNMRWQQLILPEDLETTNSLIEYAKINEDRVYRIVNRYIGKDNDIAWLDWGLKYIKHKNTFVVTARDITEKKKIEEQNKVYEKAIELESIRNEFFSNISHEFKTPLNIILATIQFISNAIDNNHILINDKFDLRKYSNSIKQNSYRLLRLINNLIDITKIDSGYYKINFENHDIVAIVEDITISVAEYIEHKGISLIFDTEIEEMVIACDPDKIERIMLNLLSNAIKYTGNKGEIKVNMTLKSNKIFVSVKDSGIGIPKEKLEVIFDRFIQVDNKLTRICEGSGIGLSLVKSLVEMHGGNICAQSQEDKGSEFIFSIPIRIEESSEEISFSKNTLNSRIEKCTIEFSDIYNL